MNATDLAAADICGTYAGAQRHRRLGEPVCEPCKAAAADYQRRWRATHPKDREREKRRNNARARALWRLANRHRHEFASLYLTELRRREETP